MKPSQNLRKQECVQINCKEIKFLFFRKRKAYFFLALVGLALGAFFAGAAGLVDSLDTGGGMGKLSCHPMPSLSTNMPKYAFQNVAANSERTLKLFCFTFSQMASICSLESSSSTISTFPSGGNCIPMSSFM